MQFCITQMVGANMILAGIDSGRRGAVFKGDLRTGASKIQLFMYGENQVLKNDLTEFLCNVDLVLIEGIHGDGRWPVNVNFKMGFFFGQVMSQLGLFLYTKQIKIIPSLEWTRAIHQNLPKTEKKIKSKEKTLMCYHKFYPHDPIKRYTGRQHHHDGIVDALMLVTYYLTSQNQRPPEWIIQ